LVVTNPAIYHNNTLARKMYSEDDKVALLEKEDPHLTGFADPSNRPSTFQTTLRQGSQPGTIPVNVEYLEQLLRSCAEALAKSRSTEHTPVNISRVSTELGAGDSVSQPRSCVAIEPKQKLVSESKRAEPIEHYDSVESKEAETLNEIEWIQARNRWAHVLNTIPDIWKEHFPTCSHSFRNQNIHECKNCHPLSNETFRLECQQDLVLARLNLEQDTASIKDAKQFLPWLSLIAFKIDQVSSLTATFSMMLVRRHLRPGGTKRKCNHFLVEVLRYFNEGPTSYLARGQQFILGSLLGFCYGRKVLGRPKDATDPTLEINFRHIVHALWVLNIIQTPRYWLTFTSSANVVQQRIPVIGSYVLEMQPLDAISRSIEEIEMSLRQRQPELTLAGGENVRCEDLNIAALRNIGGLRVVWTACDRDHLFLDQENGVLRLSFFNRALVPEFYRYMPLLGGNDVARTWSLLLGYRKHTNDVSELEGIPLPPELIAYSTYMRRKARKVPLPDSLRRSGSSHILRSGINPKQIPDIRDKLNIEVQPLPRSVPYDYFGRYEQRIRILRHYMDTRKPTGFRNLWHDRRDSLTYFTFWAVLIFGGLSILLAALGVALGVAQTIAAYRQLEQSDQ
jgi:hypothetical protein